MSRLRVALVVEGHGEVEAAPILIRRIWQAIDGEYVEVLAPVRAKKDRLVDKTSGRVKVGNLESVLVLAWEKLINPPGPTDPTLVLILLDADDHCPADLGPGLLEEARRLLPEAADVACVLANVEYETWFVAGAESLTKYLDRSQGFDASDDPEAARRGKAWVKRHLRDASYTETRHQPAMTSAMDLAKCREGSQSFDKLCRELERRLQGKAPSLAGP